MCVQHICLKQSLCCYVGTLGEGGGEGAQVAYTDVAVKLQDIGLDRGWGSTVGRMKETIRLLLDIKQAPDAETLQDFLGRLPIISRVTILSPHGFFAQSNALGKPDTGGQAGPSLPGRSLPFAPWSMLCYNTQPSNQPPRVDVALVCSHATCTKRPLHYRWEE